MVSPMFLQNITKFLLWEWRYRKLDVKHQMDIEIANTLIVDTLKEFKRKTIKMENSINQRSPLSQDIEAIQQYIKEINRIIQILKLRKYRMKSEIKRLKKVCNILNSAPYN